MEILAHVTRNGLIESTHRGVAVRVDASGSVVWSRGTPDHIIFPRSTNKPFQALGMLEVGLPLDGRLLALASSSHSAEDLHLAGVRQILALADVDETALQTPAAYPIDPKQHAAVLRAGEGRLPIRMDCSGKHAAMLLTCRVNGWSIDDYLEPDHPLQQAIRGSYERWVGSIPVTGVDGCGAPLFAIQIDDLARGMSRLMLSGGHAERLRTAMSAHREYVSGTRRAELPFMQSVPGSVFKTGAEAVFVAGLPDGSAVAVKIEDGHERAMYVVMAQILAEAGVSVNVPRSVDVLGGGNPVGSITPAW